MLEVSMLTSKLCFLNDQSSKTKTKVGEGCCQASCQPQVGFQLIRITRINEQFSRWRKMAGNLYIIITLSGVKQSRARESKRKERNKNVVRKH